MIAVRLRAVLLLVCLGLIGLSTEPAIAQDGSAQADSDPQGATAPTFPDVPLRDLVIRQWQIADGLPTESLTDVLRTADGFLWISSYEGLFRFDGLTFETYDRPRINAERLSSQDPEVAADGFFHLAEDAEGVLWIGGSDGQLLRYRDDRFRIVPTAIEGPIYGVCIDSENRLWIGGRSPAVITLGRENEALSAKAIPELNEIAIQSVVCDSNTVWMGTDQGQLYQRRNGEDFESVELDADSVEALALSRDGSMWVGMQGGLSRVGGEKIQTYDALNGVGVYHLIEDRRGDLWLATSRGLGRLRNAVAGGEEVEWLDAADSGAREIHSLFFDGEGHLWLAGRRGGLFRLVEGKLGRLGIRDGLPPGSIDAILERRNGDVLIGADDQLMVVDTDMRLTPWKKPSNLDPFDVLTLLEDRNGALWAGSYLGLWRIEGDKARLYSQDTGFPSSQIRALHEDAEGNLWIGTGNRGVLTMDTQGNVAVLDHASGLISDFVFSIDADRSGNLLFGLRGGFQVLTPDRHLTSYRAPKDFPGSMVFSILADDDGTYWLSTDAGLVRFKDQVFKVLDSRVGLPAEDIFDVREDGFGWLWMTSSKGLISVFKDSLNRYLDNPSQELKVVLFDEADGMSNRQCTGARRAMKSRDGRIWVPTHGGVTIVDPRRLAFNGYAPAVTIDRVLADDRDIRLDTANVGEVVLPPGVNRYKFEFAVLSLRDPEKNQARYMLEGYDTEWQDAEQQEGGGQRTVAYTGLQPGPYVFRVVGSNDDGVWNDEGARFAFRVRPLFYETLTFRVGCGLLFVIAIAGFVRWRTNIVRRRHQELQRISERSQKLNEELVQRNAEIDRYLYIFSHDFKNPLLTIRSFSTLIRKDMEDGRLERAQRDADRIAEAADLLNQQLDDLLKVARVGAGTTTREMVPFIHIVLAAVDRRNEEIRGRGIELVVFRDSTEAETLEVFGDRERLTDVFDELLKNALKFMGDPPRPKIEIGGRRDGDEAVCWIRDNGIGVASAYHEKIFRPLEQLDPESEGTGIGLALVSRVVHRHSGRVWVESAGEGQGTTMWLTLPLLKPKHS